MPTSGGGHHFLVGGLFSVNHFRLDPDGTLSGSALPHGVASLSPNGRWATVRVADSTYWQIENQFLVVDLSTQAVTSLFREQFSPEMHWKLEDVRWLDDERFVLNSSVWGNSLDWESVLVRVDSSRGTVEVGDVFATRSRVCPSPDGEWLQYMAANSDGTVYLEVRPTIGTTRGAAAIMLPIDWERIYFDCPGEWSGDSRHLLLGPDPTMSVSALRVVILEGQGSTGFASVTHLSGAGEYARFSTGSNFLVSGDYPPSGCHVISIATGANFWVKWNVSGMSGATCLTSARDEFLVLGDSTQVRMAPLLGAENTISDIANANLLVNYPDGSIRGTTLVPYSDQLLYWLEGPTENPGDTTTASVFWMDVPNSGGLLSAGFYRQDPWGMLDYPLGGDNFTTWGNRISPKGTYLASYSGDGRLLIYRLRSPLSSADPKLGSSRFTAFAWAPDESGFFVARASTSDGSSTGRPQLVYVPLVPGSQLEFGPLQIWEDLSANGDVPQTTNAYEIGIWMPERWD